MGLSRPEYWSGWPFPSPGDLPDPEIKLGSPTLQADALPSEPPGKPLAKNRVLLKKKKKKRRRRPCMHFEVGNKTNFYCTFLK